MPARPPILAAFFLAAALLAALARPAAAQVLPTDFVDDLVFDGAIEDVQGIFALRFAPDGRMFFSEWRRGYLRVAKRNPSTGQWTLLSTPFHAFATPDSNPSSPTARRGTLRGFDFDPDFATNGYIYATYMHDAERSGYRIVRIQASTGNPDRSTGSETLFLRCPFHPDNSQPDAHNGGGLVVSGGKLYVAFGDGWVEASAQNTSVFAGKVVRLNLDGTIPTDNIWYNTLTGDRRAIVALGQRNPICLTRHPSSGTVYISGFTGANKSGLYKLVQGANYGHGGYNGFGTQTGEWTNTKNVGSGHTWLAWYPSGGSWPSTYHLNAFAVNWVTNGEIIRISGGESSPAKSGFARNLHYSNLSTVAADVGPDGHLYYTVREYGERTDLHRLRYTGAPPPSLPTVTITADASTVAEGGSTTLRVKRTGSTSGSLSVGLQASGSATSGSDYAGLPASVTIASGAAEATLVLSITDDALQEADETVGVQVKGSPAYTVGSPGSVSVTIPANDVPLRDPDLPSATAAGLETEYYHLTNPAGVAAMDTAAPQWIGTRPNFSIATPDGRADQFGFRFVGFFDAPADGVYEFETSSDDGSTFHLGSTLVVNNDGTHGVQARTGTIGLKRGLHAILVRYFEAAGGQSLAVRYRSPSMGALAAVPDALLRHVPTAGGSFGLTTRGSVGAYLDGKFPTSAGGALPATLTATGAFSDLGSLAPRSGLIPFGVNSPLWSDGAAKRRWIAVPDGQTVGFSPAGSWTIPAGTVLVKHFELPIDETNPSATRRLETRFLVVTGASAGYGATYKWRVGGTEADLVASGGATESYTIALAGGGMRSQAWPYPSRAQCLDCHTTSAGFVLGVNARQLNGDFAYPATGVTDNQVRSWSHVGLFNRAVGATETAGLARMAPVSDASATLEHRVRSYLDANCAQCHRPGGTGQGYFDARFDTPIEQQGLVEGPVQNSLGIAGALVVAPGDRSRSMAYHRMDLRGNAEQMPTVASNERDLEALAVLDAWIASLGSSSGGGPVASGGGGGGGGGGSCGATGLEALFLFLLLRAARGRSNRFPDRNRCSRSRPVR